MKIERATIRTNQRYAFPHTAEYRPTENWSVSGAFNNEREAVDHAEELAKLYPHLHVRVVHYMYSEGAPAR